MTDTPNHTNAILSFLGGASGIFTLALKGVKPAIRWGIEKALKDPKWSHLLEEYRVEIEAFFSELDSAAKDAKAEIDKAAATPPTPPAK